MRFCCTYGNILSNTCVPNCQRLFAQKHMKYLGHGSYYMVRKGVPAPSFLRHPPLDPASLLLFEIFVSPPFFSVPPPFKVFYSVPPSFKVFYLVPPHFKVF